MVHIPGIDISTGSLGQGISTAVGMALAAQAKPARYIYQSLDLGKTV